MLDFPYPNFKLIGHYLSFWRLPLVELVDLFPSLVDLSNILPSALNSLSSPDHPSTSLPHHLMSSDPSLPAIPSCSDSKQLLCTEGKSFAHLLQPHHHHHRVRPFTSFSDKSLRSLRASSPRSSGSAVEASPISSGGAVEGSSRSSGGAVELSLRSLGGAVEASPGSSGGAVETASISSGGAVEASPRSSRGAVESSPISSAGAVEASQISSGGTVEASPRSSGGTVEPSIRSSGGAEEAPPISSAGAVEASSRSPTSRSSIVEASYSQYPRPSILPTWDSDRPAAKQIKVRNNFFLENDYITRPIITISK